jgi:hypothetical protein
VLKTSWPSTRRPLSLPSELITHLAFYSGWGNAMSAVESARSVA